MPQCLSPDELNITRKACAVTFAKHEQTLTTLRTLTEIALVSRATIQQSRDLMAWSDVLLNIPGRAAARGATP
jgi:hypothetical protein